MIKSKISYQRVSWTEKRLAKREARTRVYWLSSLNLLEYEQSLGTKKRGPSDADGFVAQLNVIFR